jgi:hypothetical protein
LARLQRRAAAPRPDSRHARKCNVCRHPDRASIEQDFLRWRSPDQIAADYGIADHSSVYRHVHAAGLFARRQATLRIALEPLIEQAETVKVTAASIVSAIRLYAQMNEPAEWTGPSAPAEVPPAPPETPQAPPADPNRQTVELEHAPNS